jgi:acetyl esterase/lipase
MTSLIICRRLLLVVLWASPIVGNSGSGGEFNGNEDNGLTSTDTFFLRDPSGPPLALWPDERKIPGERPGVIGKESVTCIPENAPLQDCKYRMVTNVTVPTMIPFLLPASDAAMIVAPGGGYINLSIDKEGIDIAQWINSMGISALVLKYRVPERPSLPFGAAPLMDAQRAMGMVRAMAGKELPHLNISKVGFMGFSAGGHLTGHLNVAWVNRSYPHVDDDDDSLPCRPDVAIMVYPWRSVSQPPVNEPISGASALNVTNQTPPTLLIQTADDKVHVENAIFYYLALKQNGVNHSELHVYPEGGYGYGICTTDYNVCSWPDRAHSYLKTLGIVPKAAAANSLATWNEGRPLAL